MKKRCFSLAMAVCMICCLTMTSCSAAEAPAAAAVPAFTDTETDAWYSGAVSQAAENNRFDPETNDQREEVASMLYHYLNLDQQPPEAGGETPAACASETKINIAFNGHIFPATLANNTSAEAFAELLKSGPLTVFAHDYGSFEKVGDLGTTLPRNDEQITTSAGDIILYQGNQITVYYAENSWSFTRLGRIDDPSGLRDALGGGDVTITFTICGADQCP